MIVIISYYDHKKLLLTIIMNKNSNIILFQPWKALTEITTDGKLYQRIGAWRERGRNGYHVSEEYSPLYEQEFFIFFKG